MKHQIKKYPVQNPLLKNYIKFFWEIQIENMLLNHKLVPQRNINLRFNLSETPHYISLDGTEHLVDDVFFAGLQDHYLNAHMKLNGRIHLLGVCFWPEGFYPFFNIPVSEFTNKFLGAEEVGLKLAKTISERLKSAKNIAARLEILESELILLLVNSSQSTNGFQKLFKILTQSDSARQISEFCKQNSIGLRKLERMFNKYVGISAMTYCTLNRFQKSLDQVLFSDYSKLSDIAYNNGYFDQMHFIKEFKRFAGTTPKNFINQNSSIFQIGKLT